MPTLPLVDEFRPDVIFLGDDSKKIMFSGLDEIKIPKVWYVTDTHIWLDKNLADAHLFDLIFVGIREHACWFYTKEHPAFHLPLFTPFTSGDRSPNKNRMIYLSFVGNYESGIHQERAEFFWKLAKRTDVIVTTGDPKSIYLNSKIVINENCLGRFGVGVNFRTFEAMAAGAMLLTEDIGEPLTGMFQPGKHCVTYRRHDVEDAMEKFLYYAEHDSLRKFIARSGRAEVLAKHTVGHRVDVVLEKIGWRFWPYDERLSRQSRSSVDKRRAGRKCRTLRIG